MHLTTVPPVRALYVHVPFCRSRCGYCDFHVDLLRAGRVRPLVDALLRELELAAAETPVALETIFVGGGTPTVLPAGELRRLLAACAALRDPAAAHEFTVEANPATVTDETAEIFAEAGVNRISLGAQSFERGELRVLERLHKPEQVEATLALLRRHGFTHFNLDLIFGIPGQTLASWTASLERTVALGVEHISGYGLTYEEGTRLHRQRSQAIVQPLDEDLEAEMYERMQDVLSAAGFEQYEISNFARPTCACRHNLVYWRNEPYLGIGPSAASYVKGLRYKNVADTAAYVAAIQDGRFARCDEERLDDDSRARESAMLWLRLNEGLGRERFAAEFGADPVAYFGPAVARHAEAGLLEVTPASVRLTRAGRLLANRVIADFL